MYQLCCHIRGQVLLQPGTEAEAAHGAHHEDLQGFAGVGYAATAGGEAAGPGVAEASVRALHIPLILAEAEQLVTHLEGMLAPSLAQVVLEGEDFLDVPAGTADLKARSG